MAILPDTLKHNDTTSYKQNWVHVLWVILENHHIFVENIIKWTYILRLSDAHKLSRHQIIVGAEPLFDMIHIV